tara:strand:+ start:123 stop:770 length:648 start_codon:yes stop_codon:yes gene_type:complete
MIKKEIKIAIIGAGGIGSNLLDLIAPSMNRCGIDSSIHLIDDDIVERKNIGHQKYSIRDVGHSKVASLAARHSNYERVRVIPHEYPLRDIKQISHYDILVIAVDRPKPRKIVHNSGVPWLDLRCQGDGYMVLDNNSSMESLTKLTPDHKPTSCQIPGSIEMENIEFGFAAVAAIGAQWLMQTVRSIRGWDTMTPKSQMGSLTHGQFPLPSNGERI